MKIAIAGTGYVGLSLAVFIEDGITKFMESHRNYYV